MYWKSHKLYLVYIRVTQLNKNMNENTENKIVNNFFAIPFEL